uniref:Sodium/calcium exchanger membrane region domain-containing protein n=1 Tax=Sinocyclocheilus rhinocerous TaxID=307959 RepID=A0A673GQR3_9TELE
MQLSHHTFSKIGFENPASTIVSDDSMSKPCGVFPLAIHEFPEDIFTKEQRKRGAVLLHVLCAVYMFYALAIICDDYFVPSLEKISENLQLSEDVAGATFMAAGSSAPELFTSLIGVFITKGDVGVGTIVGSAVFNILVIIGVCGIFARQTVVLTWWSLFRDSLYYIFSVLALILVSLSGSPQESAVVMVDELLILRPHQLSFPEAGLRVMITPHFSPRTRLTMAGRMLISEVNSNITLLFYFIFISKVEVENSQPEEEDEDGDEILCVLCALAGYCARLKWLVSWPLAVLLYYTVPNCVLPRWHRWFMITFIASTLWIAIFSYLMVWMVTIISYTLGIPDYIMGITFLAAGTSVPDCMASLIVARQGMGDMAVSNSIGSNIFDILLGLGFPWALRTLVVDHGSAIFINNKGLVYSVILLLASVFLTVSNALITTYKNTQRVWGSRIVKTLYINTSKFYFLTINMNINVFMQFTELMWYSGKLSNILNTFQPSILTIFYLYPY